MKRRRTVRDIYRHHSTCIFSIGKWNIINSQRDEEFIDYLDHEIAHYWIDPVTGNAYLTLVFEED